MTKFNLYIYGKLYIIPNNVKILYTWNKTIMINW